MAKREITQPIKLGEVGWTAVWLNGGQPPRWTLTRVRCEGYSPGGRKVDLLYLDVNNGDTGEPYRIRIDTPKNRNSSEWAETEGAAVYEEQKTTMAALLLRRYHWPDMSLEQEISEKIATILELERLLQPHDKRRATQVLGQLEQLAGHLQTWSRRFLPRQKGEAGAACDEGDNAGQPRSDGDDER